MHPWIKLTLNLWSQNNIIYLTVSMLRLTRVEISSRVRKPFIVGSYSNKDDFWQC